MSDVCCRRSIYISTVLVDIIISLRDGKAEPHGIGLGLVLIDILGGIELMKFKLTQTDSHWNKAVADDYPCVKDFNYEREDIDRGREVNHYDRQLAIVKTEKVIDIDEYITVDSVEDLVKLSDGVKAPLIFTGTWWGKPEIEIYDDYRE